jgi:hypothetical protein
MTFKSLLILLLLIGLCLPGISQDNLLELEKITDFPDKFLGAIKKKTDLLESKLDRHTAKYLQRLMRYEQKLKMKLQSTDSTEANNTFGDIKTEYAKITEEAIRKEGNSSGNTGQYLAHVDSLKTSLAFLEKNSSLLSSTADIKGKINISLKQVQDLQTKLQKSEYVKDFIRQRREKIKEALSHYTKLPKGLGKMYSDFNKEFYYYSLQVKEYRDILNNPDRLAKKAFHLLSRLDAFQRFFKQYSELAGLFGVPDDYGTPQALAGMQTRSQVQQLIQTQLSGAGPNAQQLLQQNLQAAQQQLNTFKDKLSRSGGSGGDPDMPDFKPNNQKTKTFLQRLEFGTNLQSVKSNYFFPVTSDLGLSVGYRLNDKSIIGIGGSYKIGWGKDIRHIEISSQGAGVRSFLDVKLKGSFFLSAGYEYNYQPATIIDNVDRAESWTESGLAGISKVVLLKTKFFKKTKVQVLWDFLSYQQQPRTQPVKFRIGYAF